MENNFVVQAIIYLAAAVFMVPLAKKLGLGSVLGYLIAGLIIGPYVLDWVGGQSGDIMHFTELGVVMMLFLIGLEVEPKMLWRWRRAIVGMGGLQVIITAAIIGYLAHTFLNLPINKGIAIGLIFAMSSTAIVLQTMTENHWLQTEAGEKAFSVLLFQDIAVIFILAILPLLSPDSASNVDTQTKNWFLLQFPRWARTLVVFGAILVIVVGGRYLARPLFQMVAATNLRELFSATALLILLAITVLMTLVGLSPALGAFLAGIVLANSEYRHELEGDIQPFKGLLLGLFFIAVGVSINVPIIREKPLMVVSIVLCVMIVKLLILAAIGWLFRMHKKQYLLFAFSLAQVGEFAFVLLTFSQKQGIFSKDFYDLLTVVVAISMALSPIFMLFLDKVWMRHVFNRFSHQTKEKKSTDFVPKDGALSESGGVIIAGYGRFGSVIGRLLKVNGVNCTILDTDSSRIELLRQIGVEVYYGDALRLDLLISAGAEKANLIVAALNGKDKNLTLVKLVKRHFPQAHIIARAHDQSDAYELMDAGVLHVYRETLGTSLSASKDALTMLGIDKNTAERAVELFRLHDEKTIKSLAAARFNKKEYYRLLRSEIDNLHLMMENDLAQQSQLNQHDHEQSEDKMEDAGVPTND